MSGLRLDFILPSDIPEDRPLTPLSPISTPEPDLPPHPFYRDQFDLASYITPPDSPIRLPSPVPATRPRFPRVNGDSIEFSANKSDNIRWCRVAPVNKFDWVLPDFEPELELSPEPPPEPDFNLRRLVTQTKAYQFEAFGPIKRKPPPEPIWRYNRKRHQTRTKKPARTRKRRKYRALKESQGRR